MFALLGRGAASPASDAPAAFPPHPGAQASASASAPTAAGGVVSGGPPTAHAAAAPDALAACGMAARGVAGAVAQRSGSLATHSSRAAAAAATTAATAASRWKLNDERIDLTVTQSYTPRNHPHLAAGSGTDQWESGLLHITNYRVVFIAHAGETLYDLPLLKLLEVAKNGAPRGGSDPFSYRLQLTFKDCCTVLIAFPPMDGSRKRVYEHLVALPSPARPRGEQNWAEGFFCFPQRGAAQGEHAVHHRGASAAAGSSSAPPPFTGWDLFNPSSVFRRQGALDKGWRVSTANANFAMCSSYPEEVCVPAHITDDVVKECAAFRSRRRIPVLSYFHADTNAALVRSAQPTTGMGILGNATKQTHENADLAMVKAIASLSSRFEIIDLRAWVSAGAQKLQGGGYEDELVYNTTVTFAGLENIHYVRDAYRKMRDICIDPNPKKWFSALDDSNWTSYIALILETAKRCVRCLTNRTSLLLHCTDGWDRTAQVVSVTQVLLDPFCRTFEGFAALVEREWVQSGHNFRNRCGYGPSPSTDESPIFLQFLDATYQILTQNPGAFEFTASFLLFLADCLHSGRFGTFLVNSPDEIVTRGFRAATQSVWTYVLRHTRRWRNLTYEGVAGGIDVDIRPHCRRVWREYFLRYAGGGAVAPACCGKWERAARDLAGQLVAAQRDNRKTRERLWREIAHREPHSMSAAMAPHSHGRRSHSPAAHSSPFDGTPHSATGTTPTAGGGACAVTTPGTAPLPLPHSQPISLAHMLCLEEEDSAIGVEGASFSSTSSVFHGAPYGTAAHSAQGQGQGVGRSAHAMQDEYERDIQRLLRERVALAREVNRLREVVRSTAGAGGVGVVSPPTPRDTSTPLPVNNGSVASNISGHTHTPRQGGPGGGGGSTPTLATIPPAQHSDPTATSDYDYEEDAAFDQFWLVDHYEADDGAGSGGACVTGTAHCGYETRRSELVPIPQSPSVHS